MSRIVKALLDDPDKRVNEACDVFTRLWRTIIGDLGMNMAMWQTKMNQFLNDPASRLSAQGKSRRRDRGNIVKQLTSNRMTWGGFLMAIHFVNPLRSKLIILNEWEHGTTVHSKVIYDRKNKEGLATLPFEVDIEGLTEVAESEPGGTDGVPVVKLNNSGIGHIIIDGMTYEVNPELGMIIPSDFQITSTDKF